MTHLPAQRELREIFGYDPETGALWFLKQRIYAGQIAATSHPHRDGYRVVRVPGVKKWFRAHRVVWKWMTGQDPQGDVDHINGDKADNRWENLRLATRSQNMANRRSPRRQRDDLPKGVTFCPRTGRYRASVTINYKTIRLGRYDTPQQAHEAYCAAAKAQFGSFARAS